MIKFADFKRKVNRSSQRKVVGMELVRMYELYQQEYLEGKKASRKKALKLTGSIFLKTLTFLNFVSFLLIAGSEDSLVHIVPVAILIFNLTWLFVAGWLNGMFE